MEELTVDEDEEGIGEDVSMPLYISCPRFHAHSSWSIPEHDFSIVMLFQSGQDLSRNPMTSPMTLSRAGNPISVVAGKTSTEHGVIDS